ncbi:MAG: c-type cytochrome, partial [Verrucomicrobia bacterium]|nr:c-type cytochrome [Verrucomicrobiota bacterium]
LRAIHTKPNLVVELVAAEPVVMDPVAIDWDARGRLWVVEQPDYPNGMDGNWKPGGRVKILTSTRGDGHYDKATLFLDGLPWPTGITCWRNGVLICAAPDIIYAEDTDGDGKADVVKKLFTGFETDNYNARINSLALGLDNWIHGANGLRGGKIRSEKTGVVTDISGRDVRLNPDTGELQLVSGVTQQGRARNDWDDWFGCSNSRWIFHFPLPDRYVRRNPHVPAPAPLVYLPADENASALNPASRSLERWNNPDAQGHITSACGLGLYRDTLFGPEFYGNAFIGEVAHNLVRRYRLDPDGATFAALRPADEAATEFFASEDNWSRFVQIRTGPDGALYIVDMYRAVIEHTRWIPADKLATLDVRAGDTMGRIYRVYPKGAKLRPIRDLTRLDAKELAAALDTPNGTTRDLVHLQLLHRNERAAAPLLERLAASSELPAVRVQALSALDGLRARASPVLLKALEDRDAQVRRIAVRLSEPQLDQSPELAAVCLRLINDPEFIVRYQLALSLGEWNDSRAANALAQLARADFNSAALRSAVVSSAARRPMEVLKTVLAHEGSGAGHSLFIGQLVATAGAQAEKPADFAPLLATVVRGGGAKLQNWQLGGLAQLLDALDRKRIKLSTVPGADAARPLFDNAHSLARDGRASDAERETALRLFARGFGNADDDAAVLAGFVRGGVSDKLQKAALAALARARNSKTAELLLADWPKRGPAQRQSIIATLLSREEWTAKLLDAVAARVVAAGEVPVASRQALARHNSETIRKRTAELLPVGGGNRAEIIAKYQSVAMLKGDGAKGATVFANNCASCHAYLGRGHELGPNLSVFRPKPVPDFLVAILDPNAAMDARFTVYNVETKDGRSLTGVIGSETATSLVVAQAGGLKDTILRSDIAELRASTLSLMPEGLEAVLAPQDIADLIAFIKGGG